MFQLAERDTAAGVVGGKAPGHAAPDPFDRAFGLGHRGQQMAGAAQPPGSQGGQAGGGVPGQSLGRASAERVRRQARPGDAGMALGLAAAGQRAGGVGGFLSLPQAVGIRGHSRIVSNIRYGSKYSVDDPRIRRRRG